MENRKLDHTVLVSFVHGYENLNISLPEEERPALWRLSGNETEIYKYPFPRNPGDFRDVASLIAGKGPLENADNFKKLPRFGFTGLSTRGDYIYAGAWNAVYEIHKKGYRLERILTHNLMNDVHCIDAVEDGLISVLTGKDAVVFTDYDGNLIDFFTVKNDLTVIKETTITEVDWRFISKQFVGSTGYWHFNYVQKIEDEIWLTSRNANCFVVVDLKKRKARLRLMNFFTPVLLHDGVRFQDCFYFTSIDGKIIIAAEAEKASRNPREHVDNIHLFNRDLVTKLIRLEETELGREPNWCRGIACKDDRMYVTIDGRYDTDLSFGLLEMDETGKIYANHRLKWSDVGDEAEIRFVTGFSILPL